MELLEYLPIFEFTVWIWMNWPRHCKSIPIAWAFFGQNWRLEFFAYRRFIFGRISKNSFDLLISTVRKNVWMLSRAEPQTKILPFIRIENFQISALAVSLFLIVFILFCCRFRFLLAILTCFFWYNSLFFSPPFLNVIQFQAALLQRWNLPEFMCAFCPFVQTVSVNVSVFTLTAIALDRNRAIINPLR